MPPPLETADPSESRPPQRDDFPAKVRTLLAQRVGWLCSNPDCQRSTIGPRMGEPGANNVGVAAHIKAASPGFARWDATQTKEERKSFHNGIWLCQTHAHQIDYDEQHFTVAFLEKWKAKAEQRAFEQLASGEGSARIERISQDLRAELASLRSDLGLPQDDDLDRVKARALVSATNHLQSFEDLDGWPQHIVPLLFQNRAKATGPTYNVDRLAEAFQSSGELALIAPPGTGKTTAMVGIARALLTAAGPIPMIVPLQEWAESNLDFFGWLANRQWFAGLTANHLRFLAHHGEASLALDGWNEIPSDARRRAMTEIKGLRRDLPLLSIALSTRPQVLDVPLDGPRVGVLPLNRAQQRELAQAVSGENGLSTLDRARAIRGLRDLMATPLYLATLLRTATDGRLPETREEILRSFVSAHEADPIRAEVLRRELSDQHASYLVALAVDAHTSGNTAISSTTATIAVGRTNTELIATYQVQTPPNPAHVLDVLVNTHALQTDSGRTYEFQHHQFQEWYASKAIERELLAHGDAPFALTDSFVTGRVNDRRWEEAILFACERMSRENASAIVAHVVLVALELDPMLAATIIRRSAEAVWNAVSASVLAWARRWHVPPNADRAVTFMIETGRPEFADLVWPVVTNVNSQVRLAALRGGGRFDMAVLGHHLDRDFSGLTEEVRESLISELIHSGGIEEEEKAAALAGSDPSAKVRIRAIESLLFEGAIEAAETLLRSSWNDTADAIARRGYTDELNDPNLIQRIEGLRQSAFDKEADPLRKAGMALNYLPLDQQGEVIERLLSDPATDLQADQGRMIAEIAGHHPDVVDRAIRIRVELGLELPWRFEEDYLIYGRTVDDGPVHALVTREDLNSDASRNAATLAGPKLIKTLCDRYLATYRAFRATGVRTEAAYAPVKHVADVIGRVQREVLLSVVATYAGIEDAEDIRVLANLLSSQQDRRRPDPVSQVTLDALAECLDTWAQRLLSAATPDRNALGELAGTMKRFPHPSHVPVLRHMLGADLALYQADVERRRAEPNNQALRQRMQMSYAWSYRDALSLVGTPEAEAVLSSFLLDDRFGPDAAIGLVRLAIPGTSTGPFTSRNYRERANTNRLRRAADPAAISSAGQTIFEAVRTVFGQGHNSENSRRAASIAALGVLIPHGEQSDILEGLLHADLGTRTRQNLLTNMGEGGYVLRADDINAGLRELLDLAATERWQLGNDHYVLRQWLTLYALSDRPCDLLPAITSLPNLVRFPVWSVRDLLPALKSIAPADLSTILIGLVQRMPELRAQHEFYDATLMLPVQEIFSVLEATAGPRGAADLNGAAWNYTDKIAPQLSETDIEWLKQRFADASSPTRRLQAQILAARGTEEIFLFLAADPLGRDVVLRSRAMRMSNFATTVVSENTSDAGFVTREVQPADCSTLRRALFHMAIGQDAAQATFGKECLTQLDSLRDEDGTVETEPRHPDISAGQPWPLVPITAA